MTRLSCIALPVLGWALAACGASATQSHSAGGVAAAAPSTALAGANSAACGTEVATVQTAVDAYVDDHHGGGTLTVGDMTRGDIQALVSSAYLRPFSPACSTLVLNGPDAAGHYTVSGR